MRDDMSTGHDPASIEPPPVVTPPPIMRDGRSPPTHPPIHRPRRRRQPPPRVWTVFTLVGGSIYGFGAVVGGTIGLFAGLSAASRTNPTAADDMVGLFSSPEVFLGMIMLAQMVMLAAAFYGGTRSPVPFLERLGLRRPSIPWWQIPILALASIIPVALGAWGSQRIHAVFVTFFGTDFGTTQQTAVRLEWLQSGPTTTAVLVIALIALVPGISEEILFRGYMQRRFIERWGALGGITLTSVCFGLLTGGATPGLLALPLGVWFGVVAWRTGSIWPAAFCHIAVNAAWMTWEIGAGVWWTLEEISATTRSGILALGAVALVVSIPILHRARPSPRRWSPRTEPDPLLSADVPASRSTGDTPARSDPPHHPM